VSDREAAERALVDLRGRLDVVEAFRRDAGEGQVLIEMIVPRAALADFTRGLEGIGRWSGTVIPAPCPADPPAHLARPLSAAFPGAMAGNFRRRPWSNTVDAPKRRTIGEDGSHEAEALSPRHALAVRHRADGGGGGTRAITRDSQKDVMVTIYNGNLGLVKDMREVRLPAGLSDVQWKDVAAQIDPTT
jgi:hypothetical protein